MKKRDKIIYWVATLWLSLGMVSTAIVQLIKVDEEVNGFKNLGFPVYLMTILGIWKILGVIAVLLPKTSLLKEWAYAGFFFVMTGALFSHIMVKGSFGEIFPSILLLILTIISWYFRPEDRKITFNNKYLEL